VVLVGSPTASAEVVADILDAAAQAHGRIKHQNVPRIDERSSAGLIEFLSLHSAACIDLEHFAKHISTTGQKMAHTAGMVLADQLLGALDAAHNTMTSSGCVSYVLGSMCFANVLLSRDGTASLLGFGSNFPMRSEPGALTVNPGTSQPLEMLTGAEPTAASDVWAFYTFWRHLAPFADLAQAFATGLSGGSGDAPDLAKHLLALDRTALHPSPQERLQSISELRDSFHQVRRMLGAAPDTVAWTTHIERIVDDTIAEHGSSQPCAVLQGDDSRQFRRSTLEVHREGRQVVLPTGQSVDLSRRRAPRQIFWRLVEQHCNAPGQALSWEELQEAGWPDERMGYESGRSRVYVAIHTLRKMGFESVLSRQDDGYFIGTDVQVDIRD
jgi:hypothetical protein